MSEKYQWPYYGIDIPRGLLHSDTKTYNIYKPQCGDLENCATNSHYTIPKKKCSNENSIILPHYTTFNKNTRKAERTYYFPEHIEDPNICNNMESYFNKIAHDEKKCDSSNNICYIKMNRDVPDVFNEIFEIIKELETVLNYLRQFCQSSNKQISQRLERRIDDIIFSYDHSRQTRLYTLADNYLNAPGFTRETFKNIRISLIINRAEYSNKNEYKEYIKNVLIEKYIFLSHLITLIIEQPVDIRKEISTIQELVECVPDDDRSVIASAKNIFSDLVQSNSDEGSPMSLEEQGLSVLGEAAVVKQEQGLSVLGEAAVVKQKQGKMSKLSVQSDTNLLDQLVKQRKQKIKQDIQQILEYNIDQNYVLEYILTDAIDIELIYNIKNKCDELLKEIKKFNSSITKDDEKIKNNKIILTRDFTDILLIYFAYPVAELIIEDLLHLNEFQLKFLTEFYYKFQNKYSYNFIRGTEKNEKKVDIYIRLYNRIQDSLFYDELSYLISFQFVVSFNNQVIDNIKNGLGYFHDIPEYNYNVVAKSIHRFKEIKKKLKTYDTNTGILEILRDIPLEVHNNNIDNQLVTNNPYDILKVQHNETYENIKLKILQIMKNKDEVLYPNFTDAKVIFKTIETKMQFDSKKEQHNFVANVFCRHLNYLIINIIYKICRYNKPTYELYLFCINQIIIIAEIYSNEILYPSIAIKIPFFLTILKKLLQINSERLQKTNQEIYAELRDHIQLPYTFSVEFEIPIRLLNIALDVLITKDNMNQPEIDRDTFSALNTLFIQQDKAVKDYIDANGEFLSTFQSAAAVATVARTPVRA